MKTGCCKLHEHGKYQKWSCSEGYDSKERRKIHLRKKKPCPSCGVKIGYNSNLCRKCNNIRYWKGDEASYSAKHRWLHRNVKKPDKCEHCGLKKRLHWANKSGKYHRDLSDWFAICVKCHSEYDNNYPPVQTAEYRKSYK